MKHKRERRKILMPDWQYALIDPEVNRKERPSIGWRLISGAPFSSTMSYLGGGVSPDPGNLSSVREAFGDLSNAAVVRMSEARDTYIATKNSIAFDEAYSDGIVLVLVLENNNGDEVSVEIPNPDLSLFESDGVTIVQPDAGGTAAQILVQAATSAFETLVNNSFDPANSYAFSRGYAATRKVSMGRPAQAKPVILEPDDVAGDNPPEAPA
jgi:hypothetical protein